MDEDKMFREVESDTKNEVAEILPKIQKFGELLNSPDFPDITQESNDLIFDLDVLRTNLVILRGFQIMAKRAINQ